MKKILIATNALLLGVILFQACGSGNQNLSEKTASYPLDSCLRKFCKEYNDRDLKGKIDADIINEMSVTYSKDAGKRLIADSCDKFINPNIAAKMAEKRDALSVVFDIEKIKNLIYQMQCTALKQKCDPSIELGIRFYYIKYPCDLGRGRHKGDGLDGLTEDQRNKHSLVMVPVYRNKLNKEWYDYNLWAINPTTCFPIITLKDHDDIGTFWGILPDTGGDNHGGVGPPPEPGTFPTSNQ